MGSCACSLLLLEKTHEMPPVINGPSLELWPASRPFGLKATALLDRLGVLACLVGGVTTARPFRSHYLPIMGRTSAQPLP